jgi:hypothetical protein
LINKDLSIEYPKRKKKKKEKFRKISKISTNPLLLLNTIEIE